MFKAKIIELFGLPRTGKTTTVLALKKHLAGLGYKVDVIKERASICPIKDKLHPSFNFWTSASLFKEYLESNDKGVDYVIADRGIFDSYTWINFIGDNNDIASFKQLMDQPFILSNYLTTFYFKADNDTIFQREFERSVNQSHGTIMNQDVLNKYRESYKKIKKELEQYREIHELDTSNIKLKETISFVSERLLESIEESSN